MKLTIFSKSNIVLKKRMNKLAIPILFSYLSNFIYSIGDQAIIGRTSITQYAAVSVVANLLFALTGTLGIITLTLNIMGSRKLGQKDYQGYQDLFSTIMTFVMIIGIGFEMISLFFGRSILATSFHMSGDLLKHAYAYLCIAGIGLGLNMVLFIYSSFFKSLERTKIILLATVTSSLINLAIDYTLVFGKFGFPEMGVIGAAIGTVVGLLINVIIYVLYFKRVSDFSFRFVLKTSFIKPILKSFVPLLGQDIIESTAFTIILTMMITKFSTQSIATYGLMTILISAMTLPIYAYSNTAMTIISKAKGAGNIIIIKNLPKLLIRQLFIIVGLVGVLMYTFRTHLPQLITNDQQLIFNVIPIVGFALVGQLFNVANQAYRYMLNALEDEKWVMYYSTFTSLLSLIVIYCLAKLANLGLKGVFIGLGFSYFINSIGFYIRYQKHLPEETLMINSKLDHIR